MTYDHIMVRFGELSTKGKNKKDFIRVLANNIKNALRDFSNVSIETRFDHIYVVLNGNDPEPIIEVLQDVSGIHSLSLVYKTDPDIENLKKVSLELIQKEEGQTFKVKAKRADKSYPIISEDIIRHVAGVILANTNLKVDVHNPDILLSIEIRQEGAYVFCKTYPAAGGYPLGVGGKIMHMLSGGIDSPVAAYLLMRRGIKIECIHFASPPYTNVGVIEKLKDLLSKLNKYQPEIRLNIIPFTKIQEEIYRNADESYAITIMRRMMFRLADRLAHRRRCPAISSGESVGQVASQTLESMYTINEVTSLPVLRPVVTMDKVDIIKLARKIDTYDISIRPFEDCCTIFAPKSPKTKPSLEKAKEFEEKFDFESLINEVLDNVEVIYVKKEDELF
ncbi:MAG: tRNA uracil 4-sulfurtransferase ThiI [Bacilli bacterium]|nr:tRNA uracil 4-sulfurtransferase ThiI [Bacilli bacterium]MDY6362776.1 tRNA uracil 4-sulfurtransferase ThiI [Bacilli bacterium]